MEITDEKLYELCQYYGKQAREWRQKFIGLLPEVYKRKLYEKKRFSSIYEFAFKLAGLSEQQVNDALNLERRLDKKNVTLLKNMLEQGEVSINKLARVASVVNGENQEFWANQVKLLPQKALEVLVRDERTTLSNSQNNELFMRAHLNVSQNGEKASADLEHSFSEKPAVAPLNSHVTLSLSKGELFLTTEVQQKLLELQQKGIDINQLILKFLSEREETIEEEKEEIGEEAQNNFIQYNITESRNVSARIKKLFKQEYGKKCSIPGCNKPWSEIHHSQRFSLAKIHDPRYMAPLCESHHKIAHSIDQKYHEKRRDFASRSRAAKS